MVISIDTHLLLAMWNNRIILRDSCGCSAALHALPHMFHSHSDKAPQVRCIGERLESTTEQRDLWLPCCTDWHNQIESTFSSRISVVLSVPLSPRLLKECQERYLVLTSYDTLQFVSSCFCNRFVKRKLSLRIKY